MKTAGGGGGEEDSTQGCNCLKWKQISKRGLIKLSNLLFISFLKLILSEFGHLFALSLLKLGFSLI